MRVVLRALFPMWVHMCVDDGVQGAGGGAESEAEEGECTRDRSDLLGKIRRESGVCSVRGNPAVYEVWRNERVGFVLQQRQ